MPSFKVSSSNGREACGLFVYGPDNKANAAIAFGLRAAGIPNSDVLTVRVGPPYTARSLVLSVIEALDRKLDRNFRQSYLTQYCLHTLSHRRYRILHIDGWFSEAHSVSAIEREIGASFLESLLLHKMSLIVNGSIPPDDIKSRQHLYRRFRFLAACQIADGEAGRLIRDL